jgi:hypothetical protein
MNLSQQLKTRKSLYQANVLLKKKTKTEKIKVDRLLEADHRLDSGITVELSNLHSKTSQEDIKVLLQRFGKIRNATLRLIGGVFRGRVTATFVHRESGLRCIQELDGKMADGKILRVIENANALSIVGMSSNGVTSVDHTKKMYSD